MDLPTLITSSSVTFQKNETKKSLTHRVFCFFVSFCSLEFLSFFLDFASFFTLFGLFRRFPISSFFIEDTFSIALLLLLLLQREREKEREKRERETKYENSRASRETTTFTTL